MNRVLSFFERQQGISNNLSYDFALSRLCVRAEDSWRGITPSTYSSDYNPEPPIFSAKFANCDGYRHILAIANEDGKIALQNVDLRNNCDHEEKSLEGQQCHFNAVFDLEWVPGQMKFLSASGDHTARLWSITESKFECVQSFNAHTRSVKTVSFRKNDSAVFATGARDGAILIWDTRAALDMYLQPRADNCIYSGHVGGPGTPISAKRKSRQTPKLCPNGASSSITGLVFQDDFTLVSCGAGDGVIKVWDLRRNYTCYKKEPLPKYSLAYAGTSTFKGFTNLSVDDSGVRLYANCMDNTIYCYNLSSYSPRPIQRYVGLRNSTFYIKSCLSPDGKYLISGSSDEKAYIWNLNNPQPLVALSGHTVEVTCVAWSRSHDMPIVTCSDDARHKIWRIGPEKIEPDERQLYRGSSEKCKDYKIHILEKRLKDLEYTPRSLKRIVETNERTPNSVEKVTTKRTFSEMTDGDRSPEYNDKSENSDHKRPHIETRGRRLFSPTTSSFFKRIAPEITETNTLASILEETDSKTIISSVISHPDDSNQENKPFINEKLQIPSTSYNLSNKLVSPLNERIDTNLISPESTSSSHNNNINTHRPGPSRLFSPTSNLPNYVLDGEAPHLHIMSPKRKVTDKLDWLTKIRKQKLMSNRSSMTVGEKVSINSSTMLDSRLGNNNSSDMCLSPRLQSLKASEFNSHVHGTPKRRNSRSGSSNSESIQPRTPTSSGRRNSETSILRFFSISSTHPIKSQITRQQQPPDLQQLSGTGNNTTATACTE